MAFARICENYSSLVLALRSRADELQISREQIDDLAGFQDNYSAKLLSMNHLRTLGPVSMGPMLEVLGLRLVLVEDSGFTGKTVQRRKPRVEGKVHYARPVGNAA